MFDRVAVLARPGTFRGREEISRAGRVLLKEGLTQLNVRYGSMALDLEFNELADQLQQRTGLFLSITHCRGMTAVALAGHPVGIDVEPTDQVRNWLGMAENFFTGSEYRAMTKHEVRTHRTKFLRSWVMKEAYIKMIRGNLFGDLNKLAYINDMLEVQKGACLDVNRLDAWLGKSPSHIFGLVGHRSVSQQSGIVKLIESTNIEWERLGVCWRS